MPLARMSRRADSTSCSTCCSSAGVSSKSLGSCITPGKYTVVRNCSASPKRMGTEVPSIWAAAAQLLVPKSIPRFIWRSHAQSGRALYYGWPGGPWTMVQLDSAGGRMAYAGGAWARAATIAGLSRCPGDAMPTSSCPQCSLENVYPDGALWICADCGHEWMPGEADADAMVVRDSNGNVLVAGDTVTVIKDLKVKGSSIPLKQGTVIRNIRLVED